VYSALYLVLAFFQAACHLDSCSRLNSSAIALVLVYVGAVMVLFLFVVMMLDINVDSLRQGFWRHFPIAAGDWSAHRAGDGRRADRSGFGISDEPKAAGRASARAQSKYRTPVNLAN
jgi:NADH-quinone oxidoreductase subunit J